MAPAALQGKSSIFGNFTHHLTRPQYPNLLTCRTSIESNSFSKPFEFFGRSMFCPSHHVNFSICFMFSFSHGMVPNLKKRTTHKNPKSQNMLRSPKYVDLAVVAAPTIAPLRRQRRSI